MFRHQIGTGLMLACLLVPTLTALATPSAAFAAPRVSLETPNVSSETPSHVHVTVDKLNIRSGPGLTYTITSNISSNTKLPVLKEQDNWYQVQLPDGKSGWLASWLVKPVAANTQNSTAIQTKVQGTVDKLNVRSGPAQTFPVIQTISQTISYPVLQKEGDWIKIQLSANQSGWVASWLVKETQATTDQVSIPAESTNIKILSVDTPVYLTPDPNSTVLGMISKGDQVTIEQEQAGWFRITFDGQAAWINNSFPQGNPVPDVTQPVDDSLTKGQATVTAETVNLRSQPGLTSTIIGKLKQGDSLTVLSRQGEWVQVQTASQQTGWVANWLVNVTGTTPDQPGDSTNVPSGQAYVTILHPDTNLRSGAATTFDILGRVQSGERYPIVATEGDWFRIRLNNGTEGYVAGWLVNADGINDVIREDSVKDKVIVVDAGHGGEDNGATGTSFSTLEKVINLQVAMLLKNKLEAAGAKVIMTRSDDRRLTLQQRVDTAVSNNADLFISVHHNTSPNTTTKGTMIFYYTEGKSSKLASLVQNEVVKATDYKDMNARFGNYFVLRENPVVSILCEIGFLTNYEEELLLRSSKQQELAAEGIYKGIVRYFLAN